MSHFWVRLAIVLILGHALTTLGEDQSSSLPPIDKSIVDQYRLRLMTDPNLRSRAQDALSNPYSSSTDSLIDKGYEKVFGRTATPSEKEIARQQLSAHPNLPLDGSDPFATTTSPWDTNPTPPNGFGEPTTDPFDTSTGNSEPETDPDPFAY